MRDDRMRAVVEARVAPDVPWVNAGQVEVDAARGDKEGGNGHETPHRAGVQRC